ncbi:DUF5986 family protein [Heyndrickxia oleronia]|nr:DUF5986 family protein [Heyndrickxia oleronia]MCM3452756.1 DUF5986 family protein [Heyndrickxia oleronia]
MIGDIVKAFTSTTHDVIREIQVEHGLDTGNFKSGGNWDLRFKRIKNAALKHGLIVLTKKRGIWNFILVLNINTGIMYVFSKDKNIKTVIKKLGKNSIHYFHAFVSLNSDPYELDNQQMELFPMLSEEYEAKRIQEVQKILGEEYPLVKQVVFVVALEEDRKIVGVEAKLFNRYFELKDVENWTSYMSTDDYSDIFISNELPLEQQQTVIPKLKQSVKDRKHHFDKTIATRKSEKEQFKEEDGK